jgi:hypothetical protein
MILCWKDKTEWTFPSVKQHYYIYYVLYYHCIYYEVQNK